MFSVSNCGPSSVPLTRGEPLFMLFICSLDGRSSRVYDGTRQNLSSIKDEMVSGMQGYFPSPQVLQEQIKTGLQNLTDEVARVHERIGRIKWWSGFVGLVLGVLFSGLFFVIWKAFTDFMAKK